MNKVKTVAVIIDGAQTRDYESLAFPARAQRRALVCHVPPDRPADSLNCIMYMLGAAPADIPEGRAYLEALSLGLPAEQDDLVFRCNSVKTENSVLLSSCALPASPPGDMPGCLFYHMGGYKNLLVVKGAAAALNGTVTYPPHENIGGKLEDLMPRAADERLDGLLKSYAAQGYWPWGQAVKCRVKSFYEINNMKAAAVCATQIVRGIAAAMEIYCPEIPGATADTDTDLAAKARAALSLLHEYDFVLVHVNGADEASHRGDRSEKLEFMRRIDKELVSPILDNIGADTLAAVTGDHATVPETGAHSAENVLSLYYNNTDRWSEKWLKRL